VLFRIFYQVEDTGGQEAHLIREFSDAGSAGRGQDSENMTPFQRVPVGTLSKGIGAHGVWQS
jgi:hypothetical protein